MATIKSRKCLALCWNSWTPVRSVLTIDILLFSYGLQPRLWLIPWSTLSSGVLLVTPSRFDEVADVFGFSDKIHLVFSAFKFSWLVYTSSVSFKVLSAFGYLHLRAQAPGNSVAIKLRMIVLYFSKGNSMSSLFFPVSLHLMYISSSI